MSHMRNDVSLQIYIFAIGPINQIMSAEKNSIPKTIELETSYINPVINVFIFSQLRIRISSAMLAKLMNKPDKPHKLYVFYLWNYYVTLICKSFA